MRTAPTLLAVLPALAAPALSAQQTEGRVAALAKEGHSRPGTGTWERHARLLGWPAPDLKPDTWMNGGVRPEDMGGRIVIVDFWSTQSQPCIDAIQRNNATAEGYADKGVLWIGVCGGRGQESMGAVVKGMGITYPVCHPGPGVTAAWRVDHWPTYGVIDRDGILRALGVGRDYVERIIDALLEEEAALGKTWGAEKAADKGSDGQAPRGRGQQTAGAPIAGKSPGPAKSAVGGRSSVTIPQDTQIYNNIGAAAGYGVFYEWMMAEKMAMGCTFEYLKFNGVNWSNGVKTGASAFRFGADLALRPEGIERGLFLFAGLGFISAEMTAAVGRYTASADGSGASFSYGAGYDGSMFGVELRFINASLEFKGLGVTDDFSSVQVGIRIRAGLW